MHHSKGLCLPTAEAVFASFNLFELVMFKKQKIEHLLSNMVLSIININLVKLSTESFYMF